MRKRQVEGPRFPPTAIALESPALVVQGLTHYLEQSNNSFPGKQPSLELIRRFTQLGIVDRMAQTQQDGKHHLLSHSMESAQRVGFIAEQLNTISQRLYGYDLVDPTVAVTAAFVHDSLKVMWPKRENESSTELEALGVNRIDVSRYTEPLRRQVRPSESHMIGILALIRSFGPQFEEFASAAAHSIHHIKSPTEPISIERLLVMFVDFTSEGKTPKGARDLREFMLEKLHYAQHTYAAPNEDYRNFFDLLLTFGRFLDHMHIDLGFQEGTFSSLRYSAIRYLVPLRRFRQPPATTLLIDYLSAIGAETFHDRQQKTQEQS